MAGVVMGKRREVPETAQLGFLDRSDAGAVRPAQSSSSADRFLAGDPESIFIGEVSLRRYLTDSGKGWVIRFRDLLFKQDAGPFSSAYKPLGRKPYHPLMMLGLILYGAQQGPRNGHGCWGLGGGSERNGAGGGLEQGDRGARSTASDTSAGK